MCGIHGDNPALRGNLSSNIDHPEPETTKTDPLGWSVVVEKRVTITGPCGEMRVLSMDAAHRLWTALGNALYPSAAAASQRPSSHPAAVLWQPLSRGIPEPPPLGFQTYPG